MRVLLVEDYPDLAEATADFLEAEGLEVRTALSGREAVEIAPVFQPQLVLCDLNLPDMSGVDVVRQLRSNPGIGRAYAVILTAIGRTFTKPADVDAFVEKPLTIDSIQTLVKAAGSANR
ncbi:MAG TPA: response regulator [Vicinamibacterales bacterium]|nr:response regulator [Vicinamibacterales bacterium]